MSPEINQGHNLYILGSDKSSKTLGMGHNPELMGDVVLNIVVVRLQRCILLDFKDDTVIWVKGTKMWAWRG